MKEKLCILFLLLGVAFHSKAESNEMRGIHPNEISIGWGDMIAETAFFHESLHRDYTLYPTQLVMTENRNYHYIGHVVFSYQYRHNEWFSYGGKVDCSGFMWDRYIFNGGSNYVQGKEAHFCYNLAFLPEVKFTWFRHYWFDLYTSLGLGLLINGGSEKDDNGRQTVCAWAADATLIGCSVGYNHLFGSIEFGGLSGLQNLQKVYLAGSRFITASIGVRF